ncbi:S-type Pyocin family protein [Klebsiella pneumoniae]|nr:S-type Pyocin family protein [Klebsiella pneumoniae]
MPIEDRDFDDFIIVDPMGVVPAIYVYFKKAPVEEYEVDYYENFEGRSRQGKYQVDHIPSRDAVRVYLEDLYPDEGSKYIDKMVDKVASVAIPIAVHQKCSETYGGRNNRKVETESGEMITKKELDARDLEAAVNANWGMSNEKIEEIRAKLHKLNRNVGLY